jgi:hypothetical protein
VPGTGPSPKETVKYFSEYSKGAQKNMMEVWNNHGFTVSQQTLDPWALNFFNKQDLRIPKNIGGMIQPMDRTMMAVVVVLVLQMDHLTRWKRWQL